MLTPLTLPPLGEAVREALLVAWLTADGAPVVAGQPLYRVETSKVAIDVEAPAAGRLHRLVEVGELLPVGATVAYLLADGDPAVATRQ